MYSFLSSQGIGSELYNTSDVIMEDKYLTHTSCINIFYITYRDNLIKAKNLAKSRISTGFAAYIGCSSGDTEKVVLRSDLSMTPRSPWVSCT